MKAVIFDFDGTIADSLLGVLAVLGHYKQELPLTTKEVNGFRNKSFYRIARECKVPFYKLVWLALFGRRAFRNHLDKVHVYTGIPDLLRSLHQKGVQCYIVSMNRAETIHDFLRINGLEQYVRAVYGKAWIFDKSGKMKQILHQEDIRPDEACAVGDEIIDIVSARRAGLRIQSVTWGYTARKALQLLNPDGLHDTVESLEKELLT